MRRLLIAIVLAACASPGFPPGAPEDHAPPVLVSMTPDSGSVNAPLDDEAEFQFDEVVSERPRGAASLSGLVLVSPRDGEPKVEWHRSRITVRPRNGWRENTVYTITITPGLSDLRNNPYQSPIVSVFSTGPDMPSTLVGGIVYDWVSGSPARGATVEAVAPDSTTYVAASDSTGTFALMHIPAGPYLLRAYQDADRSREIGLREPWDSISITLADSVISDLYLFVHDSVGPRIASVSVSDSLHLRVNFDKPISPRQALDSTLFTLFTTADSVRVRVVSARRAREAEGVPAESAAANLPVSVVPVPVPPPVRRDTAAAPPVRPGQPVPAVPPRPKRQSPATAVVLEVATPLPPETSYRLTATDILNLLGLPGTSSRQFTTPRAVPRTPAAGDSTAVPPDSVRTPPPPPPPTSNTLRSRGAPMRISP